MEWLVDISAMAYTTLEKVPTQDNFPKRLYYRPPRAARQK
jgi:hypothetical protein